jgi:hypothetical protein
MYLLSLRRFETQESLPTDHLRSPRIALKACDGAMAQAAEATIDPCASHGWQGLFSTMQSTELFVT